MFRIILVAIVLLSGCTAMHSVPINSENDTAQGQSYFLPTTAILLVVSLSSERDQIEIAASQPEYIPDLAHGYSLNAKFSAFNSDEYEIKTDERGLLKTIDMESQGRLDEALVNLSKSVGAFFLEANIQDKQRIPVFQQRIDIAEIAEDPAALAALNTAINQAIIGSNFKTTGEAAELRALKDNPKPVTLSVRRISLPVGTPVTTGAPKCHVGICYRRLVPYELIARFANGSQFSSLIEVPNGSPTFASAVRRGAFTDWNTLITLNKGMVTGYEAKNGSEAEELFLLPFELVGGAIDGITKQGELFTSQTTRARKQLELIEQRRKLEQAEEKRLEAALDDEAVGLFSFRVGAQSSGGSSLYPQIRRGGSDQQQRDTSGQSATGGNASQQDGEGPELSGPPPLLSGGS